MTTKRKTEEPAAEARAPLIALDTFLDGHDLPRVEADVLRALHWQDKYTVQGWKDLSARLMGRGE